MFNRKLKYGLMLSLLALGVVLASVINSSQKSDELKVIFFDVGQGDAILVSQGSYQMLIDGGRDGKLLLNKLGKYIPFWDRNIEVMLATHPDQDHIAGLINVLNFYNVKTIVKTGDQSETQTFKRFQDDIANERAENIEAKRGLAVKFPSGALAEIIYPFSGIGNIQDNQSNSGSVAVKINYGENSFLLTGDLPKEQEKEIINFGEDIASQVLKVAHHGSKYSTSAEFLEKINPKDAIISVGKDNSYGHPNEETTNLLKEKGINIFRTDEMGDIVYSCRKDLPCAVD
ncbi:MAG: ComEC/Rec2 family competence protein [Parcubacteria group bacterium]